LVEIIFKSACSRILERGSILPIVVSVPVVALLLLDVIWLLLLLDVMLL